jgi:hypothetical protein
MVFALFIHCLEVEWLVSEVLQSLELSVLSARTSPEIMWGCLR